MCMHTRSQSRDNFPHQEASPVIVEPLRIELSFLEDKFQEDPPVDPPEVSMADNQTMAELLQAPTEGYEDAIIIPEIAANNFGLRHGLINHVQNKQFFGHDKEDPACSHPLLQQDHLYDEGPKRTKACPHHGIFELHQLDTFYNALNINDQDSLNSAAGGNFLDKMPRECLKIIESKSKVRQLRAKAVIAKVSTSSSTPAISSEVYELKDMVRALLLDKKNQSSAPAASSTPALVKAVEPNCVTCGGAHSYQNCPTTRGNVYRDNIQEYVSQVAAANYNQGNIGFRPQMVADQIRPLGFPPYQNHQNNFNRGNNFNQNQGDSPAIVEPLRIEFPFLEDQFQEDPPKDPPEVPMADNQTMAELLRAPTEGYANAIVILEIAANNFELKHGLMNLVQNKQFFGHDKEDPHAHICYFNYITWTMRVPNVPSSSIKFMLFPFSLEGAARIWLEKEAPRSILTWDDLVSKLINQFFPPSKMTNLRNEITIFQQRFDESFYEAWERFNDLLRACPHHGFSELHQLDTFYNALNSKSKVRQTRAKVVVAKVSTSSSTPAISSDVAELNDMVRALLLDKKNQSSAPASSSTPAPVKAVNQPSAYQALAYQAPIPQTQSVSKTDFESYVKANDVVLWNMQNQGQNLQIQMANLTDMLSKFVSSNTASSSRSGTLPSNTITNPKEDLKGITTRRGVAYQGPTIPTPSKVVKQATKVTKDQVQTPSLQSTAPVQPPVIQFETQTLVSEPIVAPVSVSMPNLKPSIPYPSRLDNERHHDQANEQIKKFYEIFKDMSFEISFMDALILMLKFASTLKALIGNKEKLSEMARNLMNEHCSAVILNKLPRKLRDPRKFLIPCKFPGIDECLALADLGASINLMPLSVDFLLFEEADAFLGLEDDPNSPKFNPFYYDPEGDILLLEAILNSEPLPPLPNHKQYLPSFKKELKVEKLLDAGLIYSIFDSPWVSPVHCIPKKGGFTVVENEENELIPTRLVIRWCVCIDYRKLNKATRKDHFPLPFMDQMLERLARNDFYCFLDGFSGYFQILIDPRDQEKTTFTCPYGTFSYRRMPFGLCNAPGTFQKCMLAIFHDMVEKIMEVFMDDFSVFRNSFTNYLSRLDKMLQRCEDTNLSLNWERSHFMVKKGIVLSHKISKNGIKVDRAKVDVIASRPMTHLF
nr:reverse transcriptase domain-containing protein [Tanacetum cinerariifolium]